MITLLPNAAARATATPWRWPPDSDSTCWEMSWIVMIPSSVICFLASARILPRSSLRNTLPMTPGARGSRPRNRLSAMSSDGDTASVW